MSLAEATFPSSKAFDSIADSLSTPSARASAISQARTLFAFTLSAPSGETVSWYVDLKKTGTVGRGLAPAGEKPDVEMKLSEEDFGRLVDGKVVAQKLFVGGRLKVRGDVMRAVKAEGVLKGVGGGGGKAKL